MDMVVEYKACSVVIVLRSTVISLVVMYLLGTLECNIIKDGRLRELIKKGQSYGEQNNRMESEFEEAVSRYTNKWARDVNVDKHVLRDWKEMVVDSVQRRISYLRQRHINKRKKHVLKKKYTNNLEYMHENLVLVLADKASNNV